MGLDLRCSVLLGTAIALTVGMQSFALAQISSATTSVRTKPANGSTKRTAGAEAAYVWERFLKLAAEPNAIVTIGELESAFGTKATHDGDFYRIHDFVALKPDSDRVAQSAYPNRFTSLVSLDFPGSLMGETCIRRNQALDDLKTVGWNVHSHSPGQSPQGDIREALPSDSPYGSYTLIKGDQGVIRLAYSESTGCATKLIMYADKVEFDRVSLAPGA
jgi:hypothetical protein